MTTPNLSGPTVVGQFYMVPCVKVEESARTSWMDAGGWVPILGPKHYDAEHLEFDMEHWHIDWRFIGHDAYSRITQRGRAPHSKVLSNDGSNRYDHALTRSPELRRIKCKREMPDFPVVRKHLGKPEFGTPSAVKWQRMERAQAVVCNKLKPGNICPHRGIDLTPFVKPDGTVICPGHGLRWDTATGDLLPHQGSAW